MDRKQTKEFFKGYLIVQDDHESQGVEEGGRCFTIKPDKLAAMIVGTAKKAGDSKYLVIDLSRLPNAHLLHAIRDLFPSGLLQDMLGTTDTKRATLIMLGGRGTHSPVHIDWTSAFNITWAIHIEHIHDVLAEWLFIAPWAVEPAVAWIIEHMGDEFPDGFAAPSILTGHRLHLKGAMRQAFLDAFSRNDVFLVEQRAGDVVVVEPGWMHQVTNLQPNIKMAWDRFDPRDFGTYALLHTSIICKHFCKGTQAPDYMAFYKVIANEIKLANV